MTKLDFDIRESLNVNIMLFADYSDYSCAPVAPTVEIKIPKSLKIYKSFICN